VVEGEAARLDRRRGSLAEAYQHPRRAMTLLPDLEQFASDHRAHGALTADAAEPAGNGYLLTVACSCGVLFAREDAEFDLLPAASLN
jgi:hypothetical protein